MIRSSRGPQNCRSSVFERYGHDRLRQSSAGVRSWGRRAVAPSFLVGPLRRIARGFPFPYGFQHLAADADGAAGITGADHSADESLRPIASLDLHPDRASDRELVIRSSVADHPILGGGYGTCLETLPPPRRKVWITCVICDLLEQTGAGALAQPEMSNPGKGIAQEYAAVVAARIAMLDPPLNGRESARCRRAEGAIRPIQSRDNFDPPRRAHTRLEDAATGRDHEVR